MGIYEGETSFLFASPNFMSGVSSVMDLGGTLVMYNESKTIQEADIKAIANDWAMVGKDIRTAAENIGKK
jgi:hypothetical protein